MATARPFAYNPGSPIAGTEQLGDLVKISFKLGIVVAILVYGLFALLMTRQVDLMARTLQTKHENLMKLLTYINLGVVVLFLVVVLVWL